jgi:hypothetical protein
MIWNTYMGPLPESPVTASSWYSGSSTTSPIDSKIFRAAESCAAFACLPAQITVAERPTTAATLGMARTTGTAAPRADSMRAVGNPAAIDTSRRDGETAGRISESTVSRI